MKPLTHGPPGEAYPALCTTVGLACDTCVSDSARHVAAICKGMRGKMIVQLFVQLYPEPACARMSARFADSYRDASVIPVPLSVESAVTPIRGLTKMAAA
jgi:hypothetical protein